MEELTKKQKATNLLKFSIKQVLSGLEMIEKEVEKKDEEKEGL